MFRKSFLAGALILGLMPVAPALAVEVDGEFGPSTERSVKRYQALHGLPPTGVADPATMWSLGLVMSGTLYRGCSGTTVRALQRALAYHERTWRPVAYGAAPRPPRPRPVPQGGAPLPPMPVPTPSWPAFETPAPTPPGPEPLPAADPRALFDGYGQAWFAPAPAGASSPRFFGGGSLWLGDFGAGGEYTLAPDLGGQAPGDVIDGQLRWRGLGPLWLGAGYRGFAGASFGTLELGLEQPLGVSWLRLRARGLGGFGTGWVTDARTGLALVLGPLTVEGGYRVMVGDGFGGLTSMGYAYAPSASAGLQF